MQKNNKKIIEPIKEPVIIEPKPVVEPLNKNDLNDFQKQMQQVFTDINSRLTNLEAMRMQQVLESPKQAPPQQNMDLPTIIAALKMAGIGGGSNSEFGSDENKTFFADVGKSDFDNFRLMQQRRMMKVMEKIASAEPKVTT